MVHGQATLRVEIEKGMRISKQTNKKIKQGGARKKMDNKANMYVAENGHSFAFQDSTHLYLRAFLDFN